MAEKTETDRLREQLFKDGLQVRREVLGEEYVNNAIDKATDFTWPGQQLITEYAWGTVWRRPGLDRKQRSLLTIGMVIAQKAWMELGLHVRGGINNGLTELEIREAVLHATVYCGTPAGVEAMITVEKTLNDMVEKGEHVRTIS